MSRARSCGFNRGLIPLNLPDVFLDTCNSNREEEIIYPPRSHEASGFGTTDDNDVNGFGVFHIDNDFGGNDKFTSLDAEDDSATRSPCLTAPTVGIASHIAEDLPASIRDFVSPYEIAKYFASLDSNADAHRAQAIRDFQKLIIRIAQRD